jgi:hypothetical protein
MKPMKNPIKDIASMDWSKRLANLFSFFAAMVVFIAWPFLPIPTLHYVIYNVDLAGTLLVTIGCAASAVYVMSREWRRAAESLATYIVYALLVATILIFSSIPFSIPLILVPGGVNLDIVLLFVSTLAFLRIWGARGFGEMFLELFFIVGIPLLLVDVYFGYTISVTAHIPIDSMVLGGEGLKDGLNKMFFMIFTFTLAYHLLVTKYGKEIEAMGILYFGQRAEAEKTGNDAIILEG